MSVQLFYQLQVLSVEDPLMLGRVRARRLIDNYDDILKSQSDPPWNEATDQWTEKDPFIFNPLLPYYVYQTPKVDEMVLGMYLTSDVKFLNQFYIQSTFYSPTATNFQYFQGANKFMGTGLQVSQPKPLKNTNGTYSDKQKHKGVFPEPGDNSLLGRGSADVVVKQDEVLIRAGKFNGNSLKPNVLPAANQQRGFLQLSRFDRMKKVLPNKVVKYISEITVSVKYLIEYHVTNPENSMDIFNGYVFLYQLKPSSETSSVNLTVDSSIPENKRSLVAIESFTNLSMEKVTIFVNEFINVCNSSNVSFDGTQLFSTNDKFPIMYRMQPSDYQLMTNPNSNFTKANPLVKCVGEVQINGDTCFLQIKLVNIQNSQVVFVKEGESPCDNAGLIYLQLVADIMDEIQRLNLGYIPIPTLQEMQDGIEPSPPDYSNVTSGIVQQNLKQLFNNVRLNATAVQPGYGLIYKKDTVGTPSKIETKEEQQSDSIATFSTYGALGSDYLYLLSHQSSIPGKKKINFDDTLYGISQEKFFSEIEPNTSSSVRGEELLDLLNLIVEFLTTHCHPFPGRAPSTETRSKLKLSTLNNEMQKARTTVLNKYIRLN